MSSSSSTTKISILSGIFIPPSFRIFIIRFKRKLKEVSLKFHHDHLESTCSIFLHILNPIVLVPESHVERLTQEVYRNQLLDFSLISSRQIVNRSKHLFFESVYLQETRTNLKNDNDKFLYFFPLQIYNVSTFLIDVPLR